MNVNKVCWLQSSIYQLTLTSAAAARFIIIIIFFIFHSLACVCTTDQLVVTTQTGTETEREVDRETGRHTSSVFNIGTLSSNASYILRLLNAFFSTIRRNVDRSLTHRHTHRHADELLTTHLLNHTQLLSIKHSLL